MGSLIRLGTVLRQSSMTLVFGIVIWSVTAFVPTQPAEAATGDLFGPPGSGAFGTSVTVLPNGNFVVADPEYDAGAVQDVGAVYLYNGTTRALISTLTGSSADDEVGSGGITVLKNGHYVVHSPEWDNGGAVNAGAITWGNGTTGITGTISSSNSLIGNTAQDRIGILDVTALSTGDYVVCSPSWDNGSIADVGAVTWGNGTIGLTGMITSSNSLVGSSANDAVGSRGITMLSDGHYVVNSPSWNNGSIVQAGAVTWVNDTSGLTGVVSSSNSLVGTSANDQIGLGGIAVLKNGHYVVNSPGWDNGSIADAGAATWGNSTTGITGTISSSNSLVGTSTLDLVGFGGVVALTNGNYVVNSLTWDNGSSANAGAVTWGSGSTGITGIISSSNSLVGTNTGDQVGSRGITMLSNGHYVVASPDWDNGSLVNAGAATWGNGTTGISGTVSSSNSLVGSRTDDLVGSFGITALTNGPYVVASPYWDNGSATNVGAATWGNGTSGITGAISSSNSLVGSRTDDLVGSFGVTALSNGNYVVRSPDWDNESIVNVGAATWGNGSSGSVGIVSNSNSLVGSSSNDQIGKGGIIALSNGNYVVASPDWDSGSIVQTGAATWGNGTTGTVGIVSNRNSLVGSSIEDRIGLWGITALSNGNYVVNSPLWNNENIVDAGAATWGNGSMAISGTVAINPSISGMQIASGAAFTIPVFEAINGLVVVGIRSENRVAFLQRPTITTLTPPPGRVKSFYLHAFTTTGAPDPTFTLQRGSTLPPGLTLTPSGVLSGFPTASGTFTFTVAASNGIPPSVSQAFTLVIEPRPTGIPWQTWFPLSMQ
jgi:hypothetical protein